MFSKSKNNTIKYGVIFEVGSGSVAGAVVSSSSTNKNPVILYTSREFLSLKQTTKTENISKRLSVIFMNIAMDVESKITQILPKKSKLDSIEINFTAPWSHARGYTHTYESENPVLITEKLLKKINETIADTLTDKAGPDLISKDANFTLINCTNIGHTANNYPISNPIGQTAKTITTTETISAVDNDIYVPVENIIKKLFPGTRVQFSTSSLILQRILSFQTDTSSTFAAIHLTYEALEMTLFRDNKIITAFSTPIGINTIARNIAKISKLPHEQVFSFLTSDDPTEFQEKILTKIKKAFEKSILPATADFFQEAQLSELLPRDFYLASTIVPSPLILDIFKEALKRSSKNRFVLHNLRTPMVHNTTNANLGSGDLGICTLAYFFHNNAQNN